MATPRAARHTDLEQQLRDLREAHRRISKVALSHQARTVETVPRFINSDTHVAVGPGTFTMQLSYEPGPDSLQVWWGSVPQPPTEWSLSGNMVTVPDPDGRIVAGRVFTAYYAVSQAAVPVASVVPGIGWGSSGPYLIVAENDDSTTYSGFAYDDSAWPVRSGPVGHPMTAPGGAPVWWTTPGTPAGATDVGIWLRRRITALEPSTLNLTVRVDGRWWLYVDGTLVASDGTGASWNQAGPYTHAVTSGTHVVALHVADDLADPAGDAVYADLNVTVS